MHLVEMESGIYVSSTKKKKMSKWV